MSCASARPFVMPIRKYHGGSVTDYGDEVVPGGTNAIAGVDGNFELAKDAPEFRIESFKDGTVRELDKVIRRALSKQPEGVMLPLVK